MFHEASLVFFFQGVPYWHASNTITLVARLTSFAIGGKIHGRLVIGFAIATGTLYRMARRMIEAVHRASRLPKAICSWSFLKRP